MRNNANDKSDHVSAEAQDPSPRRSKRAAALVSRDKIKAIVNM